MTTRRKKEDFTDKEKLDLFVKAEMAVYETLKELMQNEKWPSKEGIIFLAAQSAIDNYNTLSSEGA